jgi:pantetheine-phosphate adenylyltransferase
MLLRCLQCQLADDALLTKKDNRDVLESLPERIQGVHRFMELFKPSLVYDIVSIHDVYGPTATDLNIQALVVSKETAFGGKAGKCLMTIHCVSRKGVHVYSFQVDKRREEKGLPQLRTFVIDVISHSSHRLEAEDVETLKQAKLSSTYIRQWIVSRQKREG